MKFRTLGVALLMGSGLALSAVASSPAVAQPYPPAGGDGPFGTGTVTPAVVEVGEEVIFSGSGFEPATIVQIAVDGIPFGTVLAEADTTFSVVLTFDAAGEYVLTATGQLALSFPLADGASALAAGVDAVPAQAPFLTRVVTATVLVTEDDDHGKPDWPKDDDWGHGGGGWGEPTGGPSGYPTSDPSGYPTGDPSGYPTSDPSGYPTDAPTDAPTTAPTVAPIETVTPPHHARPPHHTGGLPFTGVETGALAAIAVALVGGGLLIRVAARKRRIGGSDS